MIGTTVDGLMEREYELEKYKKLKIAYQSDPMLNYLQTSLVDIYNRAIPIRTFINLDAGMMDSIYSDKTQAEIGWHREQIRNRHIVLIKAAGLPKRAEYSLIIAL